MGVRDAREAAPARPGTAHAGQVDLAGDLELFWAAVRDTPLQSDVHAGLDAVEQLLIDSTKSDLPFVSETARHLVDAGGKRFRPLLVLLAAQFGDPTAPGVVPAAAVVELTHLATLYHDDVQDEAAMRRGVPTANSLWDNTIAILTGDFLFARASDILADLGPTAVRIQARTFERLVTGQIKEAVGPEDGQSPVDHYLGVLADKTGSLIATSGRFGGMLSGAEPAYVETLARFGERFGVAFQLSDDVLDIVGDAAQSGKEPGTDLRAGVPTLPVLYAQASDDPAGARLRELLAADLSDPVAHAEALALLRENPAMRQTREVIRGYTDSAREALAALPDNPARRALDALCDLVLDRSI
jgi:heptaprenyl diphosphate synthase